MFQIVLHEPKIPPNTGNIIRLCANTGCVLHLIEPLGFDISEKQLRRAGLDYHNAATIQTWPSFEAFRGCRDQRLISFSTKSTRLYSEIGYRPGDCLIFGSETAGLPQSVFDRIEPELQVTLPMRGDSRSLNLSNSVAIAIYEAWRQNGFQELAE